MNRQQRLKILPWIIASVLFSGTGCGGDSEGTGSPTDLEVDAGEDRTAEVGEVIRLAPTIGGSSDEWTAEWSGEGLEFTDPSEAETEVTAAEPGTYTAVLTVTADSGSATDSVELTFVDEGSLPLDGGIVSGGAGDAGGAGGADDAGGENRPPSVEVGSYDPVGVGETLELTGEVSDPDGDTVTVTWEGPSQVSFADPSSPVTTVTATEAGEYTLTLTADDGELTASAEVDVVFLGIDPVVVVPDEVRAYVGIAATLAVGVEYAGEETLTYAWEVDADSPTDEVTFEDAALQTPSALFSTEGDYTLTVTVTAGDRAVEANVQVTVFAVPNRSLKLGLVARGVNDTGLISTLESWGHEVTLLPVTSAPAVATVGQDAILLSSDMDSLQLQTGWADLGLPLLVWEYYALDQLGMSETIASDAAHDTSSSGIISLDAEGVLAAGLSGDVVVSQGSGLLSANPQGDVQVLARWQTTETTVGDVAYFVYEAGAMMYDRLAPARRVGLPLGLSGQPYSFGERYTADGKALIEGALAWAVDAPWAPRTRVLTLGDGITSGTSELPSYRQPLATQLAEAGCIYDMVGTQTQSASGNLDRSFDGDHDGHVGATSASALEALPGYLAGNVPAVALVYLGTQDLLAAESVATITENLRSIVETLREANPSVAVLLTQVAPATGVDVAPLNAAVATLAEELDTVLAPVQAVDVATGFDTGSMSADGVFPNAEGESHIAAAFIDGLRPYMSCTGSL